MRRYLLISTIAILFSGAARILASVDVMFFYFVILINIPILFLFWDFTLPKAYVLVLAYICFSGVLEVAFGPDTISQYSKEVVGIVIVSFYFYLFFETAECSVLQIFNLYAATSFWVSLIGICICFAQLLIMHVFEPVKSILPEPAVFSMVITPSLYYYASIRNNCKYRMVRVLVILLALILSVSSVGYLGILLISALLLRKKSAGLFLAPFVVGILFIVAYASNDRFQLRVDDTARSVTSLDVSGANLSSYALVSNAYVAIRAFHDRPIFGYGVGGHVIAHAKYIQDLPGADLFGDMIDLNAQDANSLFLRILSEFGLVGIILLFIFMIKFWGQEEASLSSVNLSAFVYLCLYLLRGGNWFSAELYFFVWVYVLTGLESKSLKKTAKSIFFMDSSTQPKLIS